MFVITVPSSDNSKTYTVRKVADDVWTCNCKGHLYQSKGQPYVCRHIAGIASSLFGFVAFAHVGKPAAEILHLQK